MKIFDRSLIMLLFFILTSCDNGTHSPTPTHNTEKNLEASAWESPLLDVLKDKAADGQEKMDAMIELGTLGDKRAVEPLIEVLKRDMEERTGLWAGAIGALGELGDSKAVPVLINALNNREEDWLGRTMAADALGNMGDPSAVESLIGAAQYGDTRESVIKALVLIGDVRAIELLISALDEAEEPETVQLAKHGLIKMGRPAISALEKELENFSKEFSNDYRRKAIREILKETKR